MIIMRPVLWVQPSSGVMARFRYITIQLSTIDLSMRLWGINSTNSVVTPQSLVLKSIVLDWILTYRNWPIVLCSWTRHFILTAGRTCLRRGPLMGSQITLQQLWATKHTKTCLFLSVRFLSSGHRTLRNYHTILSKHNNDLRVSEFTAINVQLEFLCNNRQ